MKRFLTMICLFYLTGCSSLTQEAKQKEQMNQNLLKEDEYSESLPAWVDKEGLHGQFVYAVGEVEGEVNQRNTLEKIARHDAEMKLLQGMPKNVQRITQRALSLDSNEFNELELSVGSIIGAEGITSSRRFSKCIKVKRADEYGYEIKLTCYQQAFMPAKKLKEAINRTIKLKYGEEKANKFNQILEEELQKEKALDHKIKSNAALKNEKNKAKELNTSKSAPNVSNALGTVSPKSHEILDDTQDLINSRRLNIKGEKQINPKMSYIPNK